MPKQKVKWKWIVLIAVLALLVGWGFFPLHYSKEYAQTFRERYAETYEQLVYLLEEDYAQHAKDGERLCYCILHENRSDVSIKRLGEYEHIKVLGENEILNLLAAENELLPEVELIYVSPDQVLFCTHMATKMFLYQKKGIPLSFFREFRSWRLYKLTGRWYYAVFTGR